MKVALPRVSTPRCDAVSQAFALRGHAVHPQSSPELQSSNDLVVLDAVSDPDGARSRCLFLLQDATEAPIVWVLAPDPEGSSWVAAGASEWIPADFDSPWLNARIMLAERTHALRSELTSRGASAERARIHARLLLADRMASVGALAAGVAHEINNPLTYVYTNIEFLSRGGALTTDIPDPERRRRVENSLAQCREGAERVRQIVRNLLTFARPDPQRRGPVFVEEILESAAALCMNEIRHRATLVRDYHPAPPVDANPARLAQIFLNLCINAVRAIPEGNSAGNTVTLSINLDPQGRVMVSVRDTGEGIHPQHIDKVFDPFFSTRPDGEGSGLGLSVCHSLVSELGGEITLESAPGTGSVFHVSLPTTPPAPSRFSLPAPDRPRRARVLIIDDEANLRVSLGQILSIDHEVILMASAREALTSLSSGTRFDVVLSDLMMPEMSGIELFTAMQSVAPDQIPRVIFLTGGAFTARAQAFLERVDNPRIEKPFELDALKTLIQHTLANTPSAAPDPDTPA